MPIAFIRWAIVTLNQLQYSTTYSNEALESTKTLLLNLFSLVSRDMTAKEKERINRLSMIPSSLGGWGYEE